MSDFFDSYKRPEWQKRRLEVMQAADFKCQDCGAADKTLNVHHSRYVRGRQPWEYEDHELRCLCEWCHEWRHKALDNMRVYLGQFPRDTLRMVMGYVVGLRCDANGAKMPWVDSSAIRLGLAAAFMDTSDLRDEVNGLTAEDGTLTRDDFYAARETVGKPFRRLAKAAQELEVEHDAIKERLALLEGWGRHGASAAPEPANGTATT